MSSTAKTSKSSMSMFIGSLPSSLAAAAFFARIAFFFTGSFHSFCFFFHSASPFCHVVQRSLNQSDGCKSSARCVDFSSLTNAPKISAHLLAGCHSYVTSANPSSLAGNEKRVKNFARTLSLKSGRSRAKWTVFFSSSVSSTGPSSSCIFASAVGSSFFSSDAMLSGSAPSAFACLALRASSAFFFFSSRSLFRSTSAALRFFSTSTLATFSASSAACTFSLYSLFGSPITTTADFLKRAAPKRASVALRSSATRFALSSPIT
mmetsp:Transcript_48926/g.136950  ORF Transcript_48926/g.136950 Transcript_48926/m.136950 type:complete len:263 (-) Transcript_48926:1209-1997(-)